MSLVVERALFFIQDFEKQFAWYVEKGSPEVAWRFHSALDVSLLKLSRQPDLGRLRHFRHPKLRDLRSYRVEPPFDKLLIFYRVDGDIHFGFRLMHGARDLPRRLRQPPG